MFWCVRTRKINSSLKKITILKKYFQNKLSPTQGIEVEFVRCFFWRSWVGTISHDIDQYCYGHFHAGYSI